ncbi:MAG: NAD(+) synthase [Planctomycetales bacterium]|nr:NAD(+) synthase [Planctomycetales bacterium]
MNTIKVAAGVVNQTPLAWDQNTANILRAVREAKDRAVSILCLPELCITGYGCEDAFHAPDVAQLAAEVLAEVTPASAGLIVSVGLPVLYQGGLFNAAALLVDGQLAGLVGKQNLAGEGLHYEPRWFKEWPNNRAVEIEIAGTTVPFGDLIFECGGIRIGFEICEDAWVADRPGLELAQRGVDILLNPSASHFAFGKHKVRRRLVLDGSRAFHTSYVYANLLGNEAGRAIYDGDAMIAHLGELLCNGKRFSYDDVQLTVAVVDIDQSRMSRARSSSFPLDLSTKKARAVKVPFTYPSNPAPCPCPNLDGWERSSSLKEEEFTRAIALGLFDYLRKSRSHGFVVSLSGGADSAAVATLSATMVQLAAQDIGLDRVRDKLAHIDALQKESTVPEFVNQLVTCAYQSTRNSSQTTRDAARAVATGVNAVFYELDVDEIVQDYIGQVSDAIERRLTWEQDDLALQNIQARVRGPSVWLLANLQGALLLATSNRSEAAVGYATMDGDTCGGLSPIAGIDKAFLRRWLRWMETNGPDGIGPFPSLRAVNEQEPTAELRPPDSLQTDEKDLMPYEILDAIERLAIRDKKFPLDVLQRIEREFTQFSVQQLAEWVERFFRLWCRNQWKRERYAPSFHLDDENLDPKTWCRFPILSGGYERELKELRDVVEAECARESS